MSEDDEEQEPRALLRMDWAGDRLQGDTRRVKRLANMAQSFFRAARVEGVPMSQPSREAGLSFARYVERRTRPGTRRFWRGCCGKDIA